MAKNIKDVLSIDGKTTSEKIEEYIRRSVAETRTNGIIMGISGGVDSALLAILAVRALGREKVAAYFLHDRNSEKDSLDKAQIVSDWLGLKLNVESIDSAMREKEKEAAFFKWISSFPKAMLPFIASIYYIVVGETPYITVLRKNEIRRSAFKRFIYDRIMKGMEEMFDGPCRERRVFLEKIAKEKNLLLIGTGNKSEDLTGWFTPDGVDNMPYSPIKGLYKAQVRMLSAYLAVPKEILKRKPSADVLKGADDTLALGMNFDKIDIILYGIENNLSDADIAQYGVTMSEISRMRRINKLSEWRRDPAMALMPADNRNPAPAKMESASAVANYQ